MLAFFNAAGFSTMTMEDKETMGDNGGQLITRRQWMTLDDK